MQSTEPKKFLVVGHARSASTFLIEQLASTTGAETPHVNHEELFNVFEKLFNNRTLRLDGSSEVATLHSYFAKCTSAFAGLKTIPSFHREWHSIVRIPGVQFITIARNDIVSCVASMLISQAAWNWRLAARDHVKSGKRLFAEWFRDRREQEMILGELLNRLLFDLRELEWLNSQPGTIALSCERLSDPFQSPQLDAFFERPVVLRGFTPLTDYRECFEDTDLFQQTIVSLLRSSVQYDSIIPRVVQDLVVASR